MNIIDPLVSGIAFSVGICLGAVLCRLATKQGRAALGDEIREYHERVENRLHESLRVHKEIAHSLGALVIVFTSIKEDGDAGWCGESPLDKPQDQDAQGSDQG